MEKLTEYQKSTKQKWDFEIKSHVMLYPDERIVAFVASNYGGKDNSEKKSLDIGFGSGRNLIPLLNNGFKCYGIDYSEECCVVARDVLKDFNNLEELICGSLESSNFPEEYFDTIICYGVLFLNKRSEMKTQLEIMYRILKNKGKLLVNFRADDDFLNGLGEKIDENTYIIDHRAKAYEGSIYSFSTLSDAISLLEECKFSVFKKEKIEFYKNDLSERHSWWILSVEK
ncbi:hypothetical protein NFHSH190041_03800 [Shewanella sp. NFH-SH190041]|uniref:class I SAM-dependent methyltransferase n=1 Tax=Shewanella sp. NFH-SH190041 TaxID=2950245 RepID=UPI0021C3B384|nr:class I SAM-dependent methyltransferase [Shewanella sp. NFH-SH190041]BDM62928.1 hypothetical protein NFHSH190041_03800 [Shewanella sp. NFH-SH190041]